MIRTTANAAGELPERILPTVRAPAGTVLATLARTNVIPLGDEGQSKRNKRRMTKSGARNSVRYVMPVTVLPRITPFSSSALVNLFPRTLITAVTADNLPEGTRLRGSVSHPRVYGPTKREADVTNEGKRERGKGTTTQPTKESPEKALSWSPKESWPLALSLVCLYGGKAATSQGAAAGGELPAALTPNGHARTIRFGRAVGGTARLRWRRFGQ